MPIGGAGDASDFYPRPPRGGRRKAPVLPFQSDFISIHALREEGDLRQAFQVQKYYISIHALREEGDKFDEKTGLFECISIHALREEGDHMIDGLTVRVNLFLSTPSARRATRRDRELYGRRSISIHALREEGDANTVKQRVDFLISIHALREEGDHLRDGLHHNLHHFYPRPPRGGRRTDAAGISLSTPFLSTPSARRATSPCW